MYLRDAGYEDVKWLELAPCSVQWWWWW